MAERHDPYVSLRNRNFLWYVASLVVLTLGTQIQATVVAWQVYALTKDPLSLGLVGLAEALPFVGALLPSGCTQYSPISRPLKFLTRKEFAVVTQAAVRILGFGRGDGHADRDALRHNRAV